MDSFYLRKFLLNDGCSLENPIKMGLEESIGIIRKICYISSLKWQEMEWQLQTLFEGLKVVSDTEIKNIIAEGGSLIVILCFLLEIKGP